ncbi:MAG: hypothetical protein ACXADX_06660 [Candidatus Hodarchaeales archaeon]
MSSLDLISLRELIDELQRENRLAWEALDHANKELQVVSLELELDVESLDKGRTELSQARKEVEEATQNLDRTRDEVVVEQQTLLLSIEELKEGLEIAQQKAETELAQAELNLENLVALETKKHDDHVFGKRESQTESMGQRERKFAEAMKKTEKEYEDTVRDATKTAEEKNKSYPKS